MQNVKGILRKTMKKSIQDYAAAQIKAPAGAAASPGARAIFQPEQGTTAAIRLAKYFAH